MKAYIVLDAAEAVVSENNKWFLVDHNAKSCAINEQDAQFRLQYARDAVYITTSEISTIVEKLRQVAACREIVRQLKTFAETGGPDSPTSSMQSLRSSLNATNCDSDHFDIINRQFPRSLRSELRTWLSGLRPVDGCHDLVVELAAFLSGPGDIWMEECNRAERLTFACADPKAEAIRRKWIDSWRMRNTADLSADRVDVELRRAAERVNRSLIPAGSVLIRRTSIERVGETIRKLLDARFVDSDVKVKFESPSNLSSDEPPYNCIIQDLCWRPLLHHGELHRLLRGTLLNIVPEHLIRDGDDADRENSPPAGQLAFERRVRLSSTGTIDEATLLRYVTESLTGSRI